VKNENNNNNNNVYSSILRTWQWHYWIDLNIIHPTRVAVESRQGGSAWHPHLNTGFWLERMKYLPFACRVVTKFKCTDGKTSKGTGVDQGRMKAARIPRTNPEKQPELPRDASRPTLTSPPIDVQAQRDGFSTVSQKEEGGGKLLNDRPRCYRWTPRQGRKHTRLEHNHVGNEWTRLCDTEKSPTSL
jgi:hypothetical protein